MKKIKENYHYIVMGIVLLLTFLIFVIGGSNKVILSGDGVLDMFIPQYKSLKNESKFFSHDVIINALGGTGRDLYYSELKINSLIFMIFPAYAAYVVLFFLKLAIGTTGVAACAKELLRDDYLKVKQTVWLAGFAFALFNVFPSYWLSVASLPWLILIILKVTRENKWKYLPLFLVYPIFSDMMHFGVFIVPCIIVYFIIAWVRNKKMPYRLLIGDVVLAAGYALSEYRYLQLLKDEDVAFIYDVEELEDLTFVKVIDTFRMLYVDYKYLPYMSAIILVVVTSLIMGLLIMLGKKSEKMTAVSGLLAVVSVVAVLFSNTEYNDILHTLTADESSVTFSEYYDTDLFSEMKADIGYMGQWFVSYGMGQGILAYNDIKTLDGSIDVPLCEGENYYHELLGKALGEDAFSEKETVNADIDVATLKEYGMRYLCSAKEIENADELGFTLVNKYSDANDDLYLYITTSRYVSNEMAEVPYEDRLKLSYDMNEFDAIIADIDGLLDEANAYKEKHPEMTDREIANGLAYDKIRQDYNKLLDFYELMQTVYSISSISFDKESNNESLAEKKEEIYSEYLDMADELLGELREICKSPYNVVIEDELNIYAVESLLEYEDMTDEEKARSEKINSLENEYQLAASEEYYFDYNGEEWTEDKLAEKSEELSAEDKYAIYTGIQKEKAKVLCEIYIELVRLNTEIAKEKDYDNYAEYAYDVSYGRDFTIDDAKKLFKEIRKYGVSYSMLIEEQVNSMEASDLSGLTENDHETYETLYPYFNEMDPEIGRTVRHILDNNLVDMNPSETKTDRGYTVTLPYYGDAYIFDSPYENGLDIFTYVHEFGHYNNDVHVDETFLESTNYFDVLEIHSQGMEAIFCDKYKDIYGEEIGRYLELNEMYTIASAVPDSCLVAEFELYVYEHPDMTLEEMGKKYARICAEYGYNVGSEAYNFVNIPHLYNSPLYYIAYATSALTSMELYTLYKENPQLATEKYLEISALGSGWKYRGINEFVGLDDVFKKGTVKKIYYGLYKAFKE